MYLSMNTFEYKSRSSNYVTDTMGLVLRMEQRKMGARAKFIFESAEADKTIIHIPSFVFAEMLYLYEKPRITVSPNDIATYLATYPNYKEAPLDFAIIQAAAKINGSLRNCGVKLVFNYLCIFRSESGLQKRDSERKIHKRGDPTKPKRAR